MIKLKTLLQENTQLKIDDFVKILQDAYKVIFDIDEVVSVRANDYGSFGFVHTYMAVKLAFVYKFERYVVYHKLYHQKFPREELKGTTYDEYMTALQHAEKFPPVITTKSILKERNPLLNLNASVYEAENNNWFEMDHIGKLEHVINLGELIEGVKLIIDKRGSSGDDGEDELAPFDPKPKTGKELVPV